MKRLFTALAASSLLVSAQSFAVTGSFTLPSAATTSAGIYDAEGVLVRTLWSNVRYNTGTYTATWNGLDDTGVLRQNGSYELRVLSNNVRYTWEGVIGNSSESFTGESVHHGLDTYFGLAVNGTSIYLASGYNEQLPSGFKASTANPQRRTKKFFGSHTNVYHVVTDGTNVYWSARDPDRAENSFVLVTRVSDDADANLPGGLHLGMTHGGAQYNVIDSISGTDAGISGLAVQKTGSYLFVAHRALNRVDVLNKSTGILLQSLSFDAPGALAVDGNDNLWMVTGTNLITRFGVAVDGTLSALGGITSGLSRPLALAVSPDGATLAIADGGTSQQVKGYSTSSYMLQWTMGEAGGYANGPTVTDYKFFFRNLSKITLGADSFSVGNEWAYLAYQPDGKLWVGDQGNVRVLRFDTDRSLVDRIQFLQGFYNTKVAANDTKRVFADYLEFEVDYTKPIAPDNGSWSLVRNWGWNVGSAYLQPLAGLRTITTLPAYGRTYALMRNFAVNKFEVVELPPVGNLRFTGVFTDGLTEALDADGALRTISNACDWPGYNPQGTRITWKKRDLARLDASNNPVWGNWVTVVTSPVLASQDVCNTVGQPWELSSSGILLAFQDNNAPLASWHLQGLDVATGRWRWRAAPSTNANYWGPYPTDGAFDVGNNNFSPYAGGTYHASGTHIFWEYHGEGWKNGQTNKWMHLHDDGLVIGQFGIEAAYTGQWLPEAAAQMAGNAFSNTVVVAADGSRYIYQNDESWHGGVHRWHVTGLETIHEESSSIELANAVQPGLQGTYYSNVGLSNATPVAMRLDSTVDFAAADTPDDSSVRWQGFVKPRYTEAYTFYVRADDGVRLWVNNVLLVDKWIDQPLSEWSDTIQLQADTLYQLKLEYRHKSGNGIVQMSWASASQAKEIVPSSQLFYTDGAPTLSGLNLHEGLWYTAGVSDGLYGWHRTPAEDVTNDWLMDWWQVDTGRYAYRRDRPADIRASFSRAGTGSVTRELRPSGAQAVNAWTLSGEITFGGNYNRNEYGDNLVDCSGQYLEVLDDAGKVIARLYSRAVSLGVAPNVAINGNTLASSLKLMSSDTWNRTIWQTPKPFSISASDGALNFTFADGSVTNVGLFDSTANWQQPTTLRMFFYHFHPNWGYSLELGLSDVTFSTSPLSH